MSSCNRHSIALKAYNILYLDLCKKKKFADSCSKETEVHRAQRWKDNESQSGRKAGDDGEEGSTEGMLKGRCGGGRCEGDVGRHRERDWPARSPEREISPQKAAHPILRKNLQKLTDLSANPGVSQTAPEISVQLCMLEWSRVPREKMLSGKTPGSELGEQRQIHIRESQGGWTRGNHHLPGSVVTRPAKGNLPCDPQTLAHTTLHFNDLGVKDSLWNHLWSNSNYS